MKAYVIFDSRYGNTEKIAKSLETGLKEAGVETACTNVDEAVVSTLNEYDLICVGGPTQYRTASNTMQGFLESLANIDLKGKRAFAFDTRRDSPFAGSAAKYIEDALCRRGVEIVSQRQSAMIVSPELERKKEEFESKEEWKEWRHKNERLREGEEGRFVQIGAQVAKILLEDVSRKN